MNSEEAKFLDRDVATADYAGAVGEHQWPDPTDNPKAGNGFRDIGISRASVCERIAVVDDDAMVRRTVVLMLGHVFKEVRVSAFPSANEALTAMLKSPPQVILLDIMMPGMSGIECARTVKREFPGARIVIITGHSNPDYVREAIHAGVMGFLVKPFSIADLRQAITGALEERLVLSASIRAQLFDSELSPVLQSSMKEWRLSKQETAVVRLVGMGMTDQAIAWELKISEYTVKTHLKRMFRKLNVTCRAQAVRCFEMRQRRQRESADADQPDDIV